MTTNSSTPSTQIYTKHDEKAAKMLERYAHQSFKNPSVGQRMRLQLIWWVIRSKLANNLKWFFDCILAFIALICLSPIMIVTALAVKFTSPGPILFSQERVGKWGKPFQCYKFRSMYIDAEARKAELMAQNEADGPVFKMKNDPRITPVGRFIRKFSLDELPQLFNVLRGDMSLVGPRPAAPKAAADYSYD